jgi:hypothetical protein
VNEDSSERPGDLQFDKAESADGAPAPPALCGTCQQGLVNTYFQVGGQPVCERCKAQVQYDQMSTSGTGRLLRASGFGLVAALLGGALWYAVRATTGYEVGLIAVVVGLMVGGAVRAGTRGRGGLLYQVLAVGLTYFGICIQYVPDIVKAIRDQPAPAQAVATPTVPGAPASVTPVGAPAPTQPAAASVPAPTAGDFLLALGLLVGLALAAPFLAGIQNIIGILIIGFALWEAWKINRHVPLEIEGPFRLAASPPGAAPR